MEGAILSLLSAFCFSEAAFASAALSSASGLSSVIAFPLSFFTAVPVSFLIPAGLSKPDSIFDLPDCAVSVSSCTSVWAATPASFFISSGAMLSSFVSGLTVAALPAACTPAALFSSSYSPEIYFTRSAAAFTTSLGALYPLAASLSERLAPSMERTALSIRSILSEGSAAAPADSLTASDPAASKTAPRTVSS